MATSIYVPLGAAMNMSTPIPAPASLLAVPLHAAFSVVNNFRSASVPWSLGSSRRTKAPGPQVGKVDTAQMIFPPVACRAERAAFNVGSSAGSGFLLWAKIFGICCSRPVITSLGKSVSHLEGILQSQGRTLIRRDPRKALHSTAQTAPQGPSSPSSALRQVVPTSVSICSNQK